MSAGEPAGSTPRLAIEDVSHAFDNVPVLRGVSLTVERGEIVCLLGPSGSGKTTLLRVVAGLERLQSGRVAIDGTIVAGGAARLPPEHRGVGMVFQDFALFPHLSALDNVAFGLDTSARARRESALDLLTRVGMADYADAFPHTLSGGQQQRVALARALARQPKLLLLDEPFSGLDSRLRGKLRDDTLHLLKRSAVAALMVTHDPEEAMFMADRIALMQGGEIVQFGRPAELYLQPRSAFAAEFFGEVNHLAAKVREGAVETPFGRLPADGVADGELAEVLIRPEAVIVAPLGDGEQLTARVVAVRMLGRSSLIHLQVEDGTSGAPHLHARVPGDVTPAEGERCAVRLDRRKAYVFPAGG
jgi:iron(III) transport system ATP-binding protein